MQGLTFHHVEQKQRSLYFSTKAIVNSFTKWEANVIAMITTTSPYSTSMLVYLDMAPMMPWAGMESPLVERTFQVHVLLAPDTKTNVEEIETTEKWNFRTHDQEILIGDMKYRVYSQTLIDTGRSQ
jgi:hypothetical protein